LVAAYYLARSDARVALVEREAAPGGGLWAGGLGRNEVVVQEEALPVLEDLGIAAEPEGSGLYAVDSVMLASGLVFKALREGATILNLMEIEDVTIESARLTGLAVRSAASGQGRGEALVFPAQVLLDATGPEATLARLVTGHGHQLLTGDGALAGPGPLQSGDRDRAVNNTRQVFPGLYVAGMAAATVFGGPRMGASLGGRLLSGKHAAELMLRELKG
jgi:thiamine thiazole synthase